MTARKTITADAHARALERVADLERALADCTREHEEARAERDAAHAREAALAEIMRIISRSPTDLQSVLDAICERAARLCGVDDAVVHRVEGDTTRPVAHFGSVATLPMDVPQAITAGGVNGRAILERRTVYLPDFDTVPEDEYPVTASVNGTVAGVRNRSFLAVPLLREGAAIGTFFLRHREPHAFSDKQVTLLQTFADQAAIAVAHTRLFEELQEQLEQQTATSRILEVISSSPAELQPVLDAVVESAVRLTGADTATIHRFDGDTLTRIATTVPASAVLRSRPFSHGLTTDRAIAERRTIHLVGEPEEIAAEYPEVAEIWRQLGTRSSLAVPLLREGAPIGVLSVRRKQPLPFTDKQIALLETFADQAAIAIENTRLYGELQESNATLREALEQQTATADVLRIISRSPADVDPVLAAVAERAARLCGAARSVIWRLEGNARRAAAVWNAAGSPAPLAPLGTVQPLDPDSAAGRATREGRVVHLADILAEPDGTYEPLKEIARTVGIRAVLIVPLMREGTAIGNMLLSHLEARPFTPQQIALVQTFADQAVIAIENARLFEELQTRNREQAEALERERATSDILRVIAASTTDPQPVFDAIVESATRLCAARTGVVFRTEGDHYRSLAVFDTIGEPQTSGLAQPVVPSSVVGRAILDSRTIHVFGETENLAQEYPQSGSLWQSQGRNPGAVLVVPLLREGTPIGAILVNRLHVEPFTATQIALLETFADQAVIAMENARLFGEVQSRTREVEERNAELREALEQQVGVGEVLRVISSSPTNLEAVFEVLATTASRLCDATLAVVGHEAAGTRLFWSTAAGYLQQVESSDLAHGTFAGTAMRDRRPVHIVGRVTDWGADFPGAAAFRRADGSEALAAYATPVLRDGAAIGYVLVMRDEPRPFTERQMALVQTFADQAMIAIENARLFEEIQSKSRELEAANTELRDALEQQTATAEVLRVIASGPTDLQYALNAVADSAVRFCSLEFATVNLVERETFQVVASTTPEIFPVGSSFPLDRDSVSGRAVFERQSVVVDDLLLADEFPTGRELARRFGHRTTLAVPLLREGEPLGVLAAARFEVRPFTAKQVSLLQTFADEAMIAIENARLFAEVQARTGELEERNTALTETLEHQRATGEVLELISRAPVQLQPVLDAIAERAARLCGGADAMVSRIESGQLRIVATDGSGPMSRFRDNVVALDRGSVTGQAILNRQTINLSDVQALGERKLPTSWQIAQDSGMRSAMVTPLLRAGEALGAMAVYRYEVRAFNEREVALLETFADQAVIAIENARLFADLNEALEHQRATGEVLEVISHAPADLQAVVDAIVTRAAALTGGDQAALLLLQGTDSHTISSLLDGQFEADARLATPRVRTGLLTSETIHATAVRERRTVAVHGGPDAIIAQYPGMRPLQDLTRARGSAPTGSQVQVPLLRDGTVFGVLNVRRTTPDAYTPAQIALLETFADQAVVAMENARLFDELQARNRELTEALEQQTATAEVLRIISRAPTDVGPVLAAIAESAARLCDASDARVWRVEDGSLRQATAFGPTLGASGRRLTTVPIDRDGVVSRSVLERRTVHVPDMLGPEGDDFPRMQQVARRAGYRTALAVPLMRQGEPLGALNLVRMEVRPFSEAQIALVQTFADQAVIAMENARLFDELQTRNRDLSEALEQQTATAEVLRVIASAPTDLQRVLDTILATAHRLVDVRDGGLFLYDGEVLQVAAGVDAESFARLQAIFGQKPMHAQDGLVVEVAALERRTIHVPDVRADSRFASRYSEPSRAGRAFGTALAVPLLRTGQLRGVIFFYRTVVQPFTDEQIALVQTFADQAVIAIENARLFDELQARNREQAEALEREQATSDILRVIAASTTDPQPVFDAIVESAIRLCAATTGVVFRTEGDHYRSLAAFDTTGEPQTSGEPQPLVPSSVAGRAILDGRTVHVFGETEVLAREFPQSGRLWQRRGREPRAVLVVPLLREGTPIGAILVNRLHMEPFTDTQIALLETFADQAVIAIENGRLFDEIQTRNRELSEALEHQRATSEVLELISHAPSDLQAVVDAIVSRAAALTGSEHAALSLVRGADRHTVSSLSEGAFLAEGRLATPRVIVGDMATESHHAVAARERRTVTSHGGVEAILAQHPYLRDVFEKTRANGRVPPGSIATLPLLRNGVVFGLLNVRRTTPDAYTPAQVALLETFADQAVVAMENARLFEEVQTRTRELEERNTALGAALDQQTAMAEVLRVIASAPTDLQQVLETILTTAHRLVDVSTGALYLYDGELLQPAAAAGPRGSAVALARLRTQQAQTPLRPRHGRVTEVAALERRTVHVPDVGADPHFAPLFSPPLDGGEPVRTALAVPLLRADQLQGVIFFLRQVAQPFTEDQIALVQTFADQAVIAIENARLFEEIQRRTRELEAASRAKSEFLSRMSHELRTPLNAIIGFGEIMEMDPATSARQHERVHHILQGGRHLLALINEVLDVTRIESGRLSLSPEPVRLDAVVQEVLDLERPLAADADVSLDLEDAEAFRIAVLADRQRLRQIVLNLVANAIKYNRPGGSVTLRVSHKADGPMAGKDEGGRMKDEPELAGVPLILHPLSFILLRVEDTGPGIPADQIGRLFAPFERLSAEASGVEGTGLGLAIARGLAEAMGGAIGVESVVGEGSVFWVELPAATAPVALPEADELARAGADGAAQATATVLYIEDNQPNVELVQHILQFRPGVTLLTAPDGATGMRIARRHRPDLILLDLNLPDLQGDDVLARLRADERTNAIPVVMISADATPGQVERLRAGGARDYLTKPLDVRRLLEVVDELAASRGKQGEDGGEGMDPHPAL